MSFEYHIVIVEDEVITQRHLQDIFAQQEMHVSGCFDNAADTLEALKTIECNIILMDINIKGSMDGIQLARKILQHYEIPIVFITAHDDNATLEELLELAPYGFIGKPFSSKEVLVAVKIAYKRHAAHTQVATVTQKNKTPSMLSIDEHYSYSFASETLYYDTQIIKLNKKQHLFIALLCKNINTTVSYDALVAYLWKEESISDSALRTLVYSVRKLLPDIPIVLYSKMGYALETKRV